MSHEIADITKLVFKHNNVTFDSPEFRAFWDNDWSIVAITDTDYNIKDLLGDTFCPEANPDICPKQLKKEEREYRARIRDDGVWGIGLMHGKTEIKYRSFVWGYVGNDFLNSGHDSDLCKMLAQNPVQVEC